MKRRAFLGTAALGAASMTVAAPAIARDTRIVWDMPTSWPAGLMLQDSATFFAEHVADLTDGQLEIRVRQAGEIVPPLEVFNAVQAGTVQCGHSWSGYLAGQNPALIIEGGIPFGLTAEQNAVWLRDAGGAEMLDEVFARFNVKSFLVGDLGGQMMGWLNREINGLDDMRGLRFRIAGLGGSIFEDVGVAVQLIPIGELLPSLERGVIDGAAGGTPTDNIRLGLHRVARYWYYPGWNSQSSGLSAYVNRDAWNELPEEFQQALSAAAISAHAQHVTHCQNLDRITIGELAQSNEDVEFRGLSAEILDALHASAQSRLNQFGEESEDFARIYTEWGKFAEQIRTLQAMTVYPLEHHRNS